MDAAGEQLVSEAGEGTDIEAPAAAAEPPPAKPAALNAAPATGPAAAT